MKEKIINISLNDDPTIVIDEDGKLEKELGSIYSKLTMNLGFCYEQLKKGQLTEGMKETHLSLSESYTLEFLNKLGYDGILKKGKEERYVEIRSTNEENRELRKQLGEKISNEDAREKIKNLSNSFKSWWNINGFGHCGDVKFTSYGALEANLSGMITDDYYTDGERKGKESKINLLKDYGFTVGDDDFVYFSDDNTRLLKQMLQNKYPSSEIHEIKAYVNRGKSGYRDIRIVIRDLNDFDQPITA